MGRLLAAPLLALAMVTLHVSPAIACINDRETVRTEAEFKSRYDGKSSRSDQDGSADPSNATPRVIPIAAIGVGVILLAGTVGLVTLNIRRVRRE